jgi:hypothetical protein
MLEAITIFIPNQAGSGKGNSQVCLCFKDLWSFYGSALKPAWRYGVFLNMYVCANALDLVFRNLMLRKIKSGKDSSKKMINTQHLHMKLTIFIL